jgi:beta-galactosidase
MKRFAGWLLFFWGCICCICASEISITDSWKYKAENDERFSSMDWNDSDWVTVDLPHTWNAGDVIDEQRGYRRGISWYRKKLFIPSEARDKKITLRFDGVVSKADVYLNGKLLKTHLGAYTAFGVDITDICEVGKENLLAVKVDNSSSLGEILPPVSGDFSIFGGIYRRVFLQWTEKVHFVTEPYAAVPVRIQTPEVSVSEASMQIVAFLKNDFTDTKHVHVNVFLCDEMNRIVKEKQLKLKLIPGRKYPISTSVGRIENPHLWSPELPYLYTVKVQVCDAKNGEMYQEVISPVGFRWFSVDKTGFYLNGKYLKLRGAARHQDYAGLGTAIPVEMNRRDMRLLKEMGANFVRISHYPQDPEIYRACDELGLIVWSEICVVNEVRKNTEFAHNCKEMLKEMILQNYNHPSVVLWGAMNELWDYHKQAIALARELEALKKELDPYRLSCVAFHAFTWEKPYTQSSKEMFSISDVNGVNVYESWYQGDSATIAPMFDKFCSYSTAKPRFLSEFGAGSDERIHSYTPRTFDFTPEFQLDFNRRYINEMEKRPDYIGYSIWNLVDFQVDGRGDSKPNLNQKGMLTEDRRKKEIYYYCQARWSDIPMIHIAGADWTKRVEICDDSINVRKISVFSNQKTAELIHNGKSFLRKATICIDASDTETSGVCILTGTAA